MSHVVVRLPIGTASFSECAADVFDRDTLTISCTDTGFDERFGHVQVYKPGRWLDATVYDERGNPLYHFVSDAEEHQFNAPTLALVRRA